MPVDIINKVSTFSSERVRRGYIPTPMGSSLIESYIRRSRRPIPPNVVPWSSADLPVPTQTKPPLRSGLIFVLSFVLSGLLQLCNVLIAAFALHFSSSTIHGLQSLGKIGMMEETILKACD